MHNVDLWVDDVFCVGKQTVNGVYGQQSNATISRCHMNTVVSLTIDKSHAVATLEADSILCYILSPDIVVTFHPTASLQ